MCDYSAVLSYFSACISATTRASSFQKGLILKNYSEDAMLKGKMKILSQYILLT